MFKIDVEELEWAGKPLRIETGRMARQADGAVVVTYGETSSCHGSCGTLESLELIFPAHRELPKKDLCRGQDPGGYFKL
jgi:polyribonucleotide nucleotidyltransferase